MNPIDTWCGRTDTNAAVRMLSDLRVGCTTLRWHPDDVAILVESHPYAEPSVPVHNAPFPQHTWLFPEGQVYTFSDTSALALRAGNDGLLAANRTTFVCRRGWTQDRARSLLTTFWEEAPAPHYDDPTTWLEALNTVETTGFWDPSMWAPAALYHERVQAAQAARALLLAQAPEDTIHWHEHDSIDILKRQPDRKPALRKALWDPGRWAVLHPESLHRSNLLLDAVQHLFPGRLGWAAGWEQEIGGGPVVLRAAPFLRLPSVPEDTRMTHHQRLAALALVQRASPQALQALHITP